MNTAATRSLRLATLVLAAALVAACQTSPSHVAPKSAVCVAAGAEASAFRRSRAPLETDTGIRRLDPKAGAVAEVFEIQGPCAGGIRGYKAGTFALADGTGFNIDSRERLTRWPAASQAVGPVDPTPANVPPLAGGRLVAASPPVDARQTTAGLVQRYVGLWRGPGHWTIGSFLQAPDGAITEVTPLLRSSLPVNGITYLPAPDTAGGRLTLVQPLDRDRARIVSYNAQY